MVKTEKHPVSYPCPECGAPGLKLVVVLKCGDVVDCFYDCKKCDAAE